MYKREKKNNMASGDGSRRSCRVEVNMMKIQCIPIHNFKRIRNTVFLKGGGLMKNLRIREWEKG